MSSEPHKIVTGIHWIGVSVSDIPASAEFYSAGVDLREVESGSWAYDPALDAIAGQPGVKAATVTVKSSNARLRFMRFNSSPTGHSIVPVNGPGIAHVCYQSAAHTNAYQRFRQNGARPVGIDGMVHLNPASPVDYAYARDHDGVMFEVEHVDFDLLGPELRPAFDHRIRHVSLATPDIVRLTDFYSKLLEVDEPRRVGWDPPMSGERLERLSGLRGAELSMAFLPMGEFELEIIQYRSHPTHLPDTPRPVEVVGYNMFVMEVSEIDAAREKVIAAGGMPLCESRSADDGRILFARDPDTNLFGLHAADPD